MYQDLSDDKFFAWWDERQAGGPESAATATRCALHPDGFSFLLPHPDAFWQTWLAFSSLELERLRFARWLHQMGRLSEWMVADARAK
jgi:hypothetical protein